MDILNLWDVRLILCLIVIIVVDITTGFVKSIVVERTNSSVGIKGLIKHSLVIILVLAISGISRILHINLETISYPLIAFYGLSYLSSIIENLGVMGIPVPRFLQNKVDEELESYKKGVDKSIK